jgi:hypothetical protein
LQILPVASLPLAVADVPSWPHPQTTATQVQLMDRLDMSVLTYEGVRWFSNAEKGWYVASFCFQLFGIIHVPHICKPGI